MSTEIPIPITSLRSRVTDLSPAKNHIRLDETFFHLQGPNTTQDFFEDAQPVRVWGCHSPA